MAKRLMDVVLSFLGLLVLLPLLVAIAVAIKLTSPGPVLHKAKRAGLGGRVFNLYKFRTMIPGAPAVGPKITGDDDPRITRIGRILRWTKLDELPQLLNVLKGDMSLVGPRPEDPDIVAGYTQRQREVLSVKPGITGLTQIRFRDESAKLRGHDDVDRVYVEQILPIKLGIDLEYIHKRSIWLDMKLLVLTLVAIVAPGRFADTQRRRESKAGC